MGVGVDVIRETLESYTGTQRRFDIIGVTNSGVELLDDYAHHPTEIKATLAAAQNMAHRKLWCIFQPHTYTRTIALFDEFVDAFKDADNVIMAEIYAAREKNIHKMSSQKVVEALQQKHPEKHALFFPSFEEIAQYGYPRAEAGDVILTMGAGDINRVAELIMQLDEEAMKAGDAAAREARRNKQQPVSIQD
jgi:UDP-N-acetylmuramate--alanine ligase